MLARFEQILNQQLQKSSFTKRREPIELLQTTVRKIIQEKELSILDKQDLIAAHTLVSTKIDEIIEKLQFPSLKNALMEVQRRLKNANELLNQDFVSLNAYSKLEEEFAAAIPMIFSGERVLQSEEKKREDIGFRLSENYRPAFVLTNPQSDETKKSTESDDYIEFDEEFVVTPQFSQRLPDDFVLLPVSESQRSKESKSYIEFVKSLLLLNPLNNFQMKSPKIV